MVGLGAAVVVLLMLLAITPVAASNLAALVGHSSSWKQEALSCILEL